MDFYFRYTEYKAINREIYRENSYYEDGEWECIYTSIEISEMAKNRALKNWIKKMKNIEEIENCSYLPPNLLDLAKEKYQKYIIEYEKNLEMERIKREKRLEKKMNNDQQSNVKKCVNKSEQKMCRCGSLGAFLCGNCNKCCDVIDCKRHKNNNVIRNISTNNIKIIVV